MKMRSHSDCLYENGLMKGVNESRYDLVVDRVCIMELFKILGVD